MAAGPPFFEKFLDEYEREKVQGTAISLEIAGPFGRIQVTGGQDNVVGVTVIWYVPARLPSVIWVDAVPSAPVNAVAFDTLAPVAPGGEVTEKATCSPEIGVAGKPGRGKEVTVTVIGLGRSVNTPPL